MNTQLILEIILIFLGLYLAFFKSYFTEKGKNLATTEDIAEITQTVESIKNNLLYSTQSRINLKTEERNALVNCFERYDIWFNTSYDTFFGGITKENSIRLQEIDDKLDNAKLQFELASSRLELFINNKEITDKFMELRVKTLEMHHASTTFIMKLETIFFELSKVSEKNSFEEQSGALKKCQADRKTISEELYNSKIYLNNIIVPLQVQLQGLIYKHLQYLLDVK